jgi:hypothetical protein
VHIAQRRAARIEEGLNLLRHWRTQPAAVSGAQQYHPEQ